ncbi:MAG: PD-(D/E)XK nuclease family protein, partial [Saprospiraceae bacterium]|nr:PD-(D/E)XK nuclease family protein [Saprospiraceae bacterium]
MKLIFGLHLDEQSNAPNYLQNEEHIIIGEKRFLPYLEECLGIELIDDAGYMRLLSYRNVLSHFSNQQPDVFYAKSFEADAMATTTKVLHLRDELCLAGWEFNYVESQLPRLKTLTEIEQLLTDFPIGFPERFWAVHSKIQQANFPFETILLNEPLKLLPKHWQQLFATLKHSGINIQELLNAQHQDSETTNLQLLQKNLAQQKFIKREAKSDSSIIILRGEREADIATFIAQFALQNSDFQPFCIIPEKNRILDDAFSKAQIPTMGLLSSSAARPSLQLLKLATAFFWYPIDPYKILEFLTTPLKPIADDLAKVIAEQFAQRPGLEDNLNYFVAQFLKEAESENNRDISTLQNQYNFWFENRKRYHINSVIPIEEATAVYNEILRWAQETFLNNSMLHSVGSLSVQAKKLVDILMSLSETQSHISSLELERVVRTVYEPTPIQFEEAQNGHFSFVYHPSAIIAETDTVLWWNFTQTPNSPFFMTWYPDEIAYFEKNNIFLNQPETENERLNWQRIRPILLAKKQLIIALPDKVNGEAVHPNMLIDNIKAIYGDSFRALQFDIDTLTGNDFLFEHKKLPAKINYTICEKRTVQPFINLPSGKAIATFDTHHFTALETLLYYPHQWVFKYKAKLRKSPILSIVKEHTLKGNLAHRFLEFLLKTPSVTTMSPAAIKDWVQQHQYILQWEGAPLLMFGKEPERAAFLNKVKNASIKLVAALQKNNWTIFATEYDINGTFSGVQMKGKADIVLVRDKEKAILDVKWSGIVKRKELLKNEEDLQLALYAQLLDAEHLPHTAFFIIEDGNIYARSDTAFHQAIVNDKKEDFQQTHQR